MSTLRDDLDALGWDEDHEEKPAPKPTGRQPGPRGWSGRGRGRVSYVQPPVRWRGTSVHVCGLNPWTIGASAPLVGVPLGRIMAGRSGAGSMLCCDPLNWFQPGNLISRPSVYIEADPGVGKSTLVRRMLLGQAGMGVNPLILGDTKPDYVKLVRALGGQVIPIGGGRGYLNVLDIMEARGAAERLTGVARDAVLSAAYSRRSTVLSGLITLLRGRSPDEREEAILARALLVLDDKLDVPAVPEDLYRLVRQGHDELREAANDHGDETRYRQVTDALEVSLYGLMGHGKLGDTFARQTSETMSRDSAVAFDVSHIDPGQTDLIAAALMACWTAGFGMVHVAQALAEAGLERQRHFAIVLDELWRVIRASAGMVDRVDTLTRLDRNEGVCQFQITHSLKDLNALPEIDRMKARGFAERAGMVIAGGLPKAEMPLLADVVDLSTAEQNLLTSWSSPPAWDSQGRNVPPPGRGKFLVKVGGRPGIPFHLELTAAELAINDTNTRWTQCANRGRKVTA